MRMYDDELRDRNTCIAQKSFHHILIHTNCRSQDACAHERYIGKSQKALHRAVLSKRSMKDGEDYIDLFVVGLLRTDNVSSALRDQSYLFRTRIIFSRSQ